MLTAIGLMSGTSLDGVDAAIIRTDGRTVQLTPHFLTLPYENSFIEALRGIIAERRRDPEIERTLTELHAEAVRQLLGQAGMQPDDVDVIGFHGQTLFHAPQQGLTCQIGDGNLLANLTGIDVVNDFRTADIKAGGQGAPLVPLFHAALLRDSEKPVAVLNIGGVANVTCMRRTPDGREILAFDTGPGNALINDWVMKHTGAMYDMSGQLAARGKIKQSVLTAWMKDPYFKTPPPKSLDRNHFSAKKVETLSLEDGAATLTAFSARAVARALAFFPEKPGVWYAAGGGRHNTWLLEQLSKYINSNVEKVDTIGFNGDAIEAQAFAFLAVRSLMAMPLTLPSTTGARFSVTGGVFCPAAASPDRSARQGAS